MSEKQLKNTRAMVGLEGVKPSWIKRNGIYFIAMERARSHGIRPQPPVVSVQREDSFSYSAYILNEWSSTNQNCFYANWHETPSMLKPINYRSISVALTGHTNK